MLIFTEYIDSKRYIEQQLRAAIADTDQRICESPPSSAAWMSNREEIKLAFNRDPIRTRCVFLLLPTPPVRA